MKKLILLAWTALAGLTLGCQQQPTGPEAAPSAYYQEPYRPQFHFSPDSMWMNDPNGMVFHNGAYHLFYQYYPDSNVWGPMHWGHAISQDLLSWEHLPIGLYPDSLGWIFSGSAVHDANNTSGLGQNGKGPLIAIFTHHNDPLAKAGSDAFQYQSLAYSLDEGQSWSKYAGNPVLPNPGIKDFRDPKVFWHQPSEQWVMALAVQDRIQFYSSPNLLQWAYLSEFGQGLGAQGGVWECPDLISLDLPGKDSTVWALLVSINPGGPNGGSATQYFLGDFDGTTFSPFPQFMAAVAADTLSGNPYWIDYGRDNYAGVTWSGAGNRQERLFMGWMSNWDYAQQVPTQRWRSAMTLPRALFLAESPDGLRLGSRPADALQHLRQQAQRFALETGEEPLSLAAIPSAAPGLELDIRLSWDTAQPPAQVIIRAENEAGEHFDIGVAPNEALLFADRSNAGPNGFSEQFARGAKAPLLSAPGEARLRLFYDRASCEAFTTDGLTAMTNLFFPSQPFTSFRILAQGGRVKAEGEFWELSRIWD
ncbi:glycoside hydrolase family 32 protein [Phaeodactylibacter luteus]|uniref:Glycoside hydrolase family 32 protein n=1 Tax=Phaeodactylibacter luteus TaxID=1564516 RepID=A0A5C6S4C7_9BACT|nr:glycoside hydrolase family 32 protein [Phaeodactylibacter luteus]TXB68840.1 glycoside hydrolase family 32 protein [Phaeodactylibacter luteus]